MSRLVDKSGSLDLRPHVHQPSKLNLEVDGYLDSYDRCVLFITVQWKNSE